MVQHYRPYNISNSILNILRVARQLSHLLPNQRRRAKWYQYNRRRQPFPPHSTSVHTSNFLNNEMKKDVFSELSHLTALFF